MNTIDVSITLGKRIKLCYCRTTTKLLKSLPELVCGLFKVVLENNSEQNIPKTSIGSAWSSDSTALNNIFESN